MDGNCSARTREKHYQQHATFIDSRRTTKTVKNKTERFTTTYFTHRQTSYQQHTSLIDSMYRQVIHIILQLLTTWMATVIINRQQHISLIDSTYVSCDYINRQVINNILVAVANTLAIQTDKLPAAYFTIIHDNLCFTVYTVKFLWMFKLKLMCWF